MRYRLTAVNLVVLALVLVVTLGAAALTTSSSSTAAVDRDLRDVATHALEQIEHEGHERSERRGRDRDDDGEDDDHDDRRRRDDARSQAREGSADLSALRFELEGADDYVILLGSLDGSVSRPDGRAIPRGLPEAQSLRAALSGRETFTDAVVADAPFRVVAVPVLEDGRTAGAVQVARRTREATTALSRTLLILGVTGLAGLVLAAGASLYLAGRAMRPIELALDRQRRFLADASHELRTPVAVLRARAELLERDAAVTPAAAKELGQLRRDADELSTLLGELLDLARLDAGDGAIELGPVPIGDVAEELAAQLAPLAEERGVRLTARGGPVFALANLARLRQVVRALADNALKHTLRGGAIELVATEESGRALFTVSDDGEGISPQHLPNVKQRFYRADPSRSRDAARKGGAGLGLAIAEELVRRMGGELTITSRPERGTRATIALPLAPRERG
ncbi:MAG: hypothetical protein IPG04_21350 [Polyangiaceae bacterium]|nr:hypothetical protein [Polyangiaceae bacterium]